MRWIFTSWFGLIEFEMWQFDRDWPMLVVGFGILAVGIVIGWEMKKWL